MAAAAAATGASSSPEEEAEEVVLLRDGTGRDPARPPTGVWMRVCRASEHA